MMKIIYDISILGMGENHPQLKTGVYRVVDALLQELLKRRDAVHFSFSHTEDTSNLDGSQRYLRERNIDGELHYTKRRFPPLKSPIRRGQGLLNRINDRLPTKHLPHITPERLQDHKIFHSTFFPVPDFIKEHKAIKRVTTVYDLIPILMKGYEGLRDRTTRTIASIGTDYAICISEYTKRDLLNYDESIDPAKVFVSLLAASPTNFYPCRDREKFEAVRKKYKLPETYFLGLSTLEPRKNIEHVIRCFARTIKEKQIADLGLVLVGTEGINSERIFEQCENAKELKDKVIFTSRVPDEDLASIYSNANSFYFMSLYEGFGLPPLEAMQCGIATVTSNTSSLPEVIGDAGIMLDPADEKGLCETMAALYSNPELNAHYKMKALQQAKKFSWEKCAQDHLEIYRAILAT